MDPTFPFIDLALAQRLERAEGLSKLGAVEARARLFPDVGATVDRGRQRVRDVRRPNVRDDADMRQAAARLLP
jgi:hypothetical protein